jgi:DNA-binding MarR family transcriptional regulator
VERVPSPTDRRSVVVRLTGRGREIIDDAVGAGLAEQARLLSHMPPAKVRTLAALLREALGDRA